MAVYKIFVSSTGDVGRERLLAEHVVRRIAVEFQDRVEVQPYFWEYEPMESKRDYQENIPLTSDFDVVICILWKRLGSPLSVKHERPGGGRWRSGTEFELVTALESYKTRGAPDIFIFKNDTKPTFEADEEGEGAKTEADLAQWKAAIAFIKEWSEGEQDGQRFFKAAVNRYQTLDQFEQVLEKVLRSKLNERFPPPSDRSDSAAPREVAPSNLPDAKPFVRWVSAVAVTPDGRRAISASEDQTLQLWDLETGQTLRTLQGHTSAVGAVAVTPDGRRAISASEDQTLRLWDLETGQTLRTLQGHTSAVDAVAVTPDGHRAISASEDQTLRLWDLETGQTLRTLQGHTSAVGTVAVTTDGRRAVSGSADKTARLWDLSAKDPGANPVVLRGHEDAVNAVAISPDNHWVVTGSGDATARLWDLSAKDPGANPVVLHGHEDAVNAVVISPDNRWVITGSWDATARLWDLSAKDPGANPVVLRGHDSRINAVAVSPDNRWLVTGSDDKTVRVWDLSAKDPAANPVVLRGHDDRVTGVAVTADGRRVVSDSNDRTLRLWDLESGRELAAFPGSLRNERVAAHPDAPAIIDQLGRDTFAEVIAARIKEVWKARHPNGSRTEDVPIGAFMIHIHGPWGSGKTSVLNFLRADLKKEVPSHQWVIVDFNAWRYQRIRPPWWTLIREIYVQSVHSVGFSRSLSLRLCWFFWRIQADWLPVLSAVVLMAMAVALASGVIKFTPNQPAPAGALPSPTASALPSATASATPAKPMSDGLANTMELGLKVVTACLAAGASLVAFSRSLVFGSARAAQTYMDLKSDPLRPIIKIFENVVKAVNRPVVVFVDDLDRCESKYVVELLEGIQTLFREAPITYVVAADRKWICSSFEKEYDAFGKTIGELGRPLGYLFLDKMFQISVSVPRLSPEVQRRYWEALLRARGSKDSELDNEQAERAQMRLEAQDKAKGADTPEKLQEMIDSALGDPLREQAVRAAAAKQITSPPASQKLEHRLQPFAPLLEPNPRSMKRLVNAYGMHLATHFLEGRSVSPESIVRWTIIELRWPLLADFLAARPQSIAVLASGKLHSSVDVENPHELEKLYDDKEVKAVLGYDSKGAIPLDERSIRQIVGTL
jgi:WD40 repeat protein